MKRENAALPYSTILRVLIVLIVLIGGDGTAVDTENKSVVNGGEKKYGLSLSAQLPALVVKICLLSNGVLTMPLNSQRRAARKKSRKKEVPPLEISEKEDITEAEHDTSRYLFKT